jgi:hypothetical protein
MADGETGGGDGGGGLPSAAFGLNVLQSLSLSNATDFSLPQFVDDSAQQITGQTSSISLDTGNQLNLYYNSVTDSSSIASIDLQTKLQMAQLQLQTGQLPKLNAPDLLQSDNQPTAADADRSFYRLAETPKLEADPWMALASFAYSVGFDVTSTVSTPDKHNVGSLHALGRAVDIRTKNKSVEEVNRLITFLLQFSIDVRDERTQPSGQKVWDGQHLHLGVPVDRAPRVHLSPLYKGAGTRVPENSVPNQLLP